MFSKALKVIARLAAGFLLIAFIINANSLYEKSLFFYVGRSVLLLKNDMGAGTGSQVIAPSGKKYIITNSHVCGDASVLEAEDFYGNKSKIAVLEVYKKHDLCLLQGIPELPSLKIGNDLTYQQDVYTVGHPQALPLVLESGKFLGTEEIKVGTQCSEEQIKECSASNLSDEKLKECAVRIFLRICLKDYEANYTNNSISPGSSGSPVVDGRGRVTALVFAGSPRYNKMAFLVPLDYIKDFLKDK